MRNTILTAVLAGTVAVSAAGAASAADSTITVSGDTAAGENQPGWLFNRDQSTATDFEFNFDEASTGEGSLFVAPIGATPSDKFIGELFLDVPVADFGGISIDYQLAPGVATEDSVHFYWNVYANFGESDPTKFYDCRYDYVASAGSDASFSELAFDPTTAPTDVTTRAGTAASPHACPATLGDMVEVAQAGSPVIRAIAINVGDTSDNDEGVGGYLDNVVLNVGADATTYDFEPAAAQTKDDCKNGGYANYGFKNQGQCIASIVANPNARK